MVKLQELLGQYFDAGVAEGREARNHDTVDGTAQRVLSEIQACVAAMVDEKVAAEREACAQVLDLKRADILLMSGEMTAGEMRSVKAVLGGVMSRIKGRAAPPLQTPK